MKEVTKTVYYNAYTLIILCSFHSENNDKHRGKEDKSMDRTKTSQFMNKKLTLNKDSDLKSYSKFSSLNQQKVDNLFPKEENKIDINRITEEENSIITESSGIISRVQTTDKE